ncbi:MAG: Exported protein [Nitrospira sp.]|nr:hypothetical protein [Nitrospira sp.]ULA58275.1 MAG: Exported protein [Nitrospira sp.]
MRAAILFLFLLLASYPLASSVEAASESSGNNKPGGNQGLTIGEIGRGLKSAAKNIEEEIPKIGPAIGKTFKQVTGSSKDTDSSKEPPPGAKPKK